MAVDKSMKSLWHQTQRAMSTLHQDHVKGINPRKQRYHYVSANQNGGKHKHYKHSFYYRFKDHHQLTIMDYCQWVHDNGGPINWEQTAPDEFQINPNAKGHDNLSSVGVKLLNRYDNTYAGSEFQRMSGDHGIAYTGRQDTLGNFIAMVHDTYADEDHQIDPSTPEGNKQIDKLRAQFIDSWGKRNHTYKSANNYQTEDSIGSNVGNDVFNEAPKLTPKEKAHEKAIRSDPHFNPNFYDIGKAADKRYKNPKWFKQTVAYQYLCGTRKLRPAVVRRAMMDGLIRSYNGSRRYQPVKLGKYNVDKRKSVVADYHRRETELCQKLSMQRFKDTDPKYAQLSKMYDKLDRATIGRHRHLDRVPKILGPKLYKQCMYYTNKRVPAFIKSTKKDLKEFDDNPKNTKAMKAKMHKQMDDELTPDGAKAIQISGWGYYNFRPAIKKYVESHKNDYVPYYKKLYTGNYNPKNQKYYKVTKYYPPKVEFSWKKPISSKQAHQAYTDPHDEKVVGADRIFINPLNHHKVDTAVPHSNRGKKIPHGSEKNWGYNMQFGNGMKNLVVFEDPIDMTNFADNYYRALQKTNTSLLSLGGCSKLKTIGNFEKSMHPGPRDFQQVVMCFDNDAAGHAHTEEFLSSIKNKPQYDSQKAKPVSKITGGPQNISVMVPGVTRTYGKKASWHKDINQMIAKKANIHSFKDVNDIRQATFGNKVMAKDFGPIRKTIIDQPACHMGVSDYSQYLTNNGYNDAFGKGNKKNLEHLNNFFYSYSALQKDLATHKTHRANPTNSYITEMEKQYQSLDQHGQKALDHFMNKEGGEFMSPHDLTHYSGVYSKTRHIPVNHLGVGLNRQQVFARCQNNVKTTMNWLSDDYSRQGYALSLRAMAPAMNKKMRPIKGRYQTQLYRGGRVTAHETLNSIYRHNPSDFYRIRKSVWDMNDYYSKMSNLDFKRTATYATQLGQRKYHLGRTNYDSYISKQTQQGLEKVARIGRLTKNIDQGQARGERQQRQNDKQAAAARQKVQRQYQENQRQGRQQLTQQNQITNHPHIHHDGPTGR